MKTELLLRIESKNLGLTTNDQSPNNYIDSQARTTNYIISSEKVLSLKS